MAYYEAGKLTKDKSPNGSNFTLYVSNIPPELNEHGLLQVFKLHGQIKSYFYRQNINWAYITYETFLEAHNAVKDLNDVPPLSLKVSFAKERNTDGVQYARASALENVEQYTNNNSKKNITLTNEPMIITRGRGSPLDVFRKIEPNPGLPKYTYTADNDMLYPYPSEPYTYNPFENAEPYTSTNTLWTRGHLTVTPDGKRHVSLGRGYTLYDIPYPDPKVEDHIDKVYEKRTSGVYEYGKDRCQDVFGTCVICLKTTKYTCEKCNTFYCSKDCQIADWPVHKVECENIPALVKHSTSQPQNETQTSMRKMSNVQIPLRRPKNLMNVITNINETSDSVSKDKNISNVVATGCNENEDTHDVKQSHGITIGQQNIHENNEINKKVTSEQNHFSSLKKPVEKEIHGGTHPEKLDNHENAKKYQKINVDNIKKIENDISFTKHTFLSKTENTDVRIIIKENCECWVQKVEDSDNIIKLMSDLQHDAIKAQKVDEPVIGNMYAVQYEDIWHRATVISLNPIKVHYVDYGNDEVLEKIDLREISKYKNVPSFCAKIRLSEKTLEKYKDLEYEDIISVRQISTDSDKVIIVDVLTKYGADELISRGAQTNSSRADGCTIPKDADVLISEVAQTNNSRADGCTIPKDADVLISKVAQTSSSRADSCTIPKVGVESVVFPEPVIMDMLPKFDIILKNIINTVTVGETGVLEIQATIKNNSYCTTFMPYTAQSGFEKLTDMVDTCECFREVCARPGIGMLICGLRDNGDWVRGYLLSTTPLKMAMVDEAKVIPIKDATPCPELYHDIPAFGVKCEVIDSKEKFNEGEQYHFKVVAVDHQNNKIEVEIMKDETIVRSIVKPWLANTLQGAIQYSPLKSGSEISLTAYRSPVVMYARPLDAAGLEYYNHVMQNVAKCSRKLTSFLKEPPYVGQMVVAQYIDGNYYRAVITKVEQDKISVSYVDFGNTEVTNIKKLKILSKDLSNLRSCTAKIILKDVPINLPMTKEVNDYLSQLVGTELPLTCTFDGIPSKDGVYLKLHNGEDINKKITELLQPTSKESAEEDKTCYMESDLPVIKLGDVGETIEALILHPIEPSYQYALCPIDHDLMTHVFSIMPQKMNEYCKASDHYIPRDEELCLALYKGSWYRAVCISRSYTATESIIFFTDFGNTEVINHQDIRLMPKEFTTPPALANICNIINMAPTDDEGHYSPEIEKRISELLVTDEIVKVKIINSDVESSSYDVELPLVRSELIEKGLISA